MLHHCFALLATTEISDSQKIGEPPDRIASPDFTSSFEILYEKQIASRVIDLRIHDGTFVRGDSEARANRGVDGYEIANNMIGKAHKADRESGGQPAAFKIHPPFAHGEALKPNCIRHYLRFNAALERQHPEARLGCLCIDNLSAVRRFKRNVPVILRQPRGWSSASRHSPDLFSAFPFGTEINPFAIMRPARHVVLCEPGGKLPVSSGFNIHDVQIGVSSRAGMKDDFLGVWRPMCTGTDCCMQPGQLAFA